MGIHQEFFFCKNMASDHLHDNCVSKHGDAKYTLLFVGLGPNAIVKTRKKNDLETTQKVKQRLSKKTHLLKKALW
jgi:hypothetical protein